MSGLKLRRVSRTDMAWRKALAGWRDNHIAAELAAVAPEGRYMAISADDGAWRARLAPRQWLSSVFPELAVLAGCACEEEDILALFNTLPRPLTFEHRALPYHKVQAVSIGPSREDQPVPLPRITARECPLWLTGITDGLVLPPKTALQPLLAVPLPVEWLIGHSRLPPALAAKLSEGDVLLISEASHHVCCQGVTIGTFRHNEEMIMTDEHYLDEPLPDEIFTGMTEADPIAQSLTSVPLKVEFILQRRFLSIGELQQLYAGKILEMDPGAEKKIELRANGRLLAKGELVQLDDRLGVEITDLFTEHIHAQ